MLVMIVCFGLLHKNMGRVSVHFLCVVSLLSALEKDKLPLTLPFFQSKHPSLLPAPNSPPELWQKPLQGLYFVGAGTVMGQCWCITAAGLPCPKSQLCPSAACPHRYTPDHHAHYEGLCVHCAL